MTNLDQLKKDAKRGCGFRNHVMGKWDTSPAKLSARCSCVKCGMQVQVETNPAPNGIEIGGEAVALNCKGLVPLTKDEIGAALRTLNNLYGRGDIFQIQYDHDIFPRSGIINCELQHGTTQRNFKVIGNTVYCCGHQRNTRGGGIV